MFLDEEAVRAFLRMEDLIPAMGTALRDLSAGEWCSRCGKCCRSPSRADSSE